ncbi:hypothetical protein [Nocardia brasiliensis]|uniref:hypothetical protein n=1 Tax=Nocardia brasiliensis TaxID=37326 RepID=UPI003D8FF819
MPAPAQATIGCSGATCVQKDDTGRYVGVLEVRIQTCRTELPGYFHVHLLGGGLDRNSEEIEVTQATCGDTRFFFQIDRRFQPCTDFHTSGWKRDVSRPNEYLDMGRPYLSITDDCRELRSRPLRL